MSDGSSFSKASGARLLHVTDHALVRWMERVCGFPMEDYRTRLADRLRSVAATGASSYKTPEAIYCFRDGMLVTVLAPEMKASFADIERYERKRLGIAAK